MAKGETIAVSVRYYNVLRHRTGVEQETVMLPAGAVLSSALTRLSERHGPHLRTMLFGPDGDISSHLVIFRNQQVVGRDPDRLALSNGDELLLFLAVAGG